jgi:pimeloyl-ACP methyl ester carboxylesterase
VYQRATGACGEAGTEPPRSTARILKGTLRTEHLPGRRTDYRLALPPGHRDGDEPGLLVFLHGRGGRAADATDGLRLQDVAAMTRSPDSGGGLAVASVTGGDGYWHPRADGRDPLALLLDEFLPLCAERVGAGGGRVVMGVSMGGYGAALTAMNRPAAFSGVVVSSGALWPSRADQAAGIADAFDSDADYARHDVVAGAHRGVFRRLFVRVDCGTADPFLAGNRAFAAAVRPREQRFDAGCHEQRTWRRYAPEQILFARRALLAQPFAT